MYARGSGRRSPPRHAFCLAPTHRRPDRSGLIAGDITDPAAVRGAMRGADLVFHQAALPSVPRSVEDPLSTHRVCATGTLQVLLAAREAGVRRVVYAASSSA